VWVLLQKLNTNMSVVAHTNSVTRRMATFLALGLCLFATTTTTIEAFAVIRVVASGPVAQRPWPQQQQPFKHDDDAWRLYSSNNNDNQDSSTTAAAAAASQSAFVPLDKDGGTTSNEKDDDDDDDDDDDLLEKVELLGKGAAKVCLCMRWVLLDT
jgi:hypothetical protein